MILKRKGQSATEYAIFIAAVLIALLALQVYYGRAVKGKVKSNADSIGEQLNTDTGVINNFTTTSVAMRDSQSGYNATVTGTDGRWSKSTISTKANSTALKTEFGNIIDAVGGAKASWNYQGGEVSTSYYDTKFGDGEVGTSTSVETANFNRTTRSVFNDTGL